MKYLIVADSSCDVKNGYIDEENIAFKSVPFTIDVGGKNFVDDENIDVSALLDTMEKSKEAGKTACPSPDAYAKLYDEADIVVCITITQHLSGSYNSAVLAKDLAKNKNVLVIDSLGEGASLLLLIDKCHELMKKSADLEYLEKELTNYRDKLTLYFIFDSFANLAKNGRLNKFLYYLAVTLKLKPVGFAENGKIALKEKVRTLRRAVNELIKVIKESVPKHSNKNCYISYVDSDEYAIYIKNELEKEEIFKTIKIRKSLGLSSFYAERNGIVVGYD